MYTFASYVLYLKVTPFCERMYNEKGDFTVAVCDKTTIFLDFLKIIFTVT